MKNQLKIILLLAVLLLSLSTVYASVRTGTILSAPATVGDSVNTFATAYEDEINGGYKVVANAYDRDHITTERKVEGMLCYVTSEATTYRLVGGNWTAVQAGGGWIKGGGRVTLETITDNVGIGTNSPAATFEVGANHTLVVNAGSGEVGIGTTSLNGKLDISSSAFSPITNVAGALFLEGSYGGGIVFKDTAYAGIWSSDSAQTLNFGSAGSAGGFGGTYGQMVLKNKNVGIGASSPISSLEVNGDLKLDARSAPSLGQGKIYFDSSSKRLNYSDGTQWIELDPAYTTKETKLNTVSGETLTINTNLTYQAFSWSFTPANDIVITTYGCDLASIVDNNPAYIQLRVDGVSKATFFVRARANGGGVYTTCAKEFNLPVKVLGGGTHTVTIAVARPYGPGGSNAISAQQPFIQYIDFPF